MNRYRRRPGLIARKIGMTRIFLEEKGGYVPVTALELLSSRLCQVRPLTEDVMAVQMVAGVRKRKNLCPTVLGHYDRHDCEPGAKMVQFSAHKDVVENMSFDSGVPLDYFKEGQKVDVTGISIGKGFAGPMKRWGFRGCRATHGVSLAHRSHGSTGQCQDPGRVFKGKKMAGRMGNRRVTVQNLLVVKIDTDLNLLFVKGALPGKKNFVTIRDGVKQTEVC